MGIEQLQEYYRTAMGDGTSTAWVKKKEHREFKESVKRMFSFIDSMDGRKEFSVYLFALKHGITEPPLCPVCGNKIHTAHGPEFPKTCSRKCNGVFVVEKEKENNLELYGVEYNTQRDDVKERRKKTNNSRYGADHPMKTESGRRKHKASIRKTYGVDNVFASGDIKKKITQTNLERYGVENPMQSDDVKEKAKNTNIERYGVENPIQNDVVFRKVKKTNLERYGSEFYRCSDVFKERIRMKNLNTYGVPHHSQRHISKENLDLLDNPVWLEENYRLLGGVRLGNLLGVGDGVIYDRLRKFNIEVEPTNKSFAEKQVLAFIQSLGFDDAISGDRTTLPNNREIDILIPSKMIGIEYNGLYWHSKKYKENNFHLEKSNAAKEVGVRLIHIFEDEWEHRQEQVKAKLKSILGVDDRETVFARKCTLINITKDEKETIKAFYDKNHIQGNGGQSLTLCLYYAGEIRAMMSFKKRTDTEYELSRYATSCRVVGGFTRLLKHAIPFLRDLGCANLVSFADKRYSEGDVYRKSGWVEAKHIKPDYQYVIDDKRVRKQNFRRKNLETILEHFDPTKSEMTNMLEHGIYPIYDCGLIKYEYPL